MILLMTNALSSCAGYFLNIFFMQKLYIKRIITGKWKENCYIVRNSRKKAIIIDPGSDYNSINKIICNMKIELIAILNTHAHFDHIGCVSRLKDRYNMPFYLHSNDDKLLQSANLYISIFNGNGYIKVPKIDFFYDKTNISNNITDFNINIIHTPGHTYGSVCLLIEDVLFTGDTLFRGKIGRTDLPGGNKSLLNESLKKISKLPENLKIYPGHGCRSTIRYELLKNEEFKEAVNGDKNQCY